MFFELSVTHAPPIAMISRKFPIAAAKFALFSSATLLNVPLSSVIVCAAAVAATERRLGPIDLLVVNHGIGSAHERLVWEQDPAVWRGKTATTRMLISSLGRCSSGSPRCW